MKPSEAGLACESWPFGEPKRGTYEIATREGRAQKTGYVLGDFAVCRPEKGEYFWQLTHRPTGLKVTVYPVLQNKLEALQMLSCAAGGQLRADIRKTIEECAAKGWGGGAL